MQPTRADLGHQSRARPPADALRRSTWGCSGGTSGISLLVLFTGTFLAGLGLQRALLAILVGAVLGTALLGLAGLIGFERRVPGMVLLRDPLGRSGLVRADRAERRCRTSAGRPSSST